MKLHTQSFFCNKGKGPICHIDISDRPYPITVRINQDLKNNYTTPYTIIYFTSLKDLVAFKNSVISEFNKAMREAKNA